MCATLDILLSSRCRQVSRDLSKQIGEHDLDIDLNFRFLEKNGTIYRETKTIGGRSIKNWPVFRDAITHIQPTLIARKEFLIVLNSSRRIEEWHS